MAVPHAAPSGEELIYLDPHTTQPAVEPCESGHIQDDSYHCQHPPCRMHICELDPSIAAVSIIQLKQYNLPLWVHRDKNDILHSISVLQL